MEAIYGHNEMKAITDEVGIMEEVLRAELVTRPGFLILNVYVSGVNLEAIVLSVAAIIRRYIEGALIYQESRYGRYLEILERPAQVKFMIT